VDGSLVGLDVGGLGTGVGEGVGMEAAHSEQPLHFLQPHFFDQSLEFSPQKALQGPLGGLVVGLGVDELGSAVGDCVGAAVGSGVGSGIGLGRARH